LNNNSANKQFNRTKNSGLFIKTWSYHLNIWKLKKQCQFDFDNGMSRSNIFEKHSENDISQKKLAAIVAAIKDATLTKKYRLLNYLLVGVMMLIAFLMTFSFYEVQAKEDT
jgi:hypothetical protein